MKKIFLLLGGNPLNFGIFNKFKQKGFLVYVVDWNSSPQIKGDKHYQIDVKDSDAIISKLEQENIINDIFFVYSSIDVAVESVAKINRIIGLKTISDNGLQYSTSKSMMMKSWSEKNLLNRFFSQYKTFDPKIADLNSQYKLIIKPDNSSSSRGITIIPKNSNIEFIKTAFQKAKKEASNSLVVIEEFIEGTEFTVEMIGDSYGNVCVYGISIKSHTKNTNNNKIAVKLHFNAVSLDLQIKIANFAIKCYKCLGFSTSFGHLEVLLKNDKTFSPVEIAARSSGFIASDLIDIVSGQDFLGDLIQVQKGSIVKNGLHPQTKFSSMYFFYDFPENYKIKNECNLTQFLDTSIKSRYHNRENIKLGKMFSKIDNDNARLGFEILEGYKSIMTPSYIEEQEKKMLIKLFEL